MFGPRWRALVLETEAMKAAVLHEFKKALVIEEIVRQRADDLLDHKSFFEFMQDSGLHGFCFEDKSTPSRTEHARCKRCLPRMNVKWRREGSKPLSARGLRLYALKKKRKCAADSFAQTVWPGKVHSPASDHSRIESLHELREMRHRKRLCDFTALLAFGED